MSDKGAGDCRAETIHSTRSVTAVVSLTLICLGWAATFICLGEAGIIYREGPR